MYSVIQHYIYRRVRHGGIGDYEIANRWSRAAKPFINAFNVSPQGLADQDWISFRPNVFALQDLATAWTEKIKVRLAEDQRADVVTERIHAVRRFDEMCIGETLKVGIALMHPCYLKVLAMKIPRVEWT